MTKQQSDKIIKLLQEKIELKHRKRTIQAIWNTEREQYKRIGTKKGGNYTKSLKTLLKLLILKLRVKK
jgi:hypothetical protein